MMYRLETRYRTAYRMKLKCCEGWVETDILPRERLRPESIRCSKIPEPTTGWLHP